MYTHKIVMVKTQIPQHRANLTDDYYLIQQMAINAKKMSVLEDWFVEKRRSTYIRLDDSYQNCEFTSKNWFRNI